MTRTLNHTIVLILGLALLLWLWLMLNTAASG